MRPSHLMSLADLSPAQIRSSLQHASKLKRQSLAILSPSSSSAPTHLPSHSLQHKTIALLFSKRSTRTRVAAETAATLLGGRALFLGKEDIQLGVNESLRDSARVIGGMCQGIFARVGEHEEIEELARHSPVPVLNALSSLWHPTQTMADLLTLHEHAHLFSKTPSSGKGLSELPPLTIAWVGDSSNVLHDMLVTYPRLGHKMRVATPNKPQYQAPEAILERVRELGCEKGIVWTDKPQEAVQGADVIVTDTWISMGQEHEKEQRLRDFAGFQITERMCRDGGAKDDWKFLHCLPRKSHEVDDEVQWTRDDDDELDLIGALKVFYGKRSLVWEEADNRKWTIMALFDQLFGHWKL